MSERRRSPAALKAAVKRLGVYERMTAALKSRRSYSQFGEDVHIRSIYDRLAFETGLEVPRSLVVDIGSYRPILLSNSYYFHTRGWRSINVDPTPGSKRLFDRIRPSDVNLEMAIGQVEQAQPFYVFGRPSVWNTMDRAAAETAEAKTGRRPEIVQVETCRVDTLLQRHGQGLPFELLLIDAEGAEMEVLRSVDFSINRPRIVLLEAHGMDVACLSQTPVVWALREWGYSLFSWINPNLLFLRDDD